MLQRLKYCNKRYAKASIALLQSLWYMIKYKFKIYAKASIVLLVIWKSILSSATKGMVKPLWYNSPSTRWYYCYGV